MLLFRPFPVDALPDPIRRFVRLAAKAIGCDPTYVALPLLSAVAAAIGNTRRVQPKHNWSEPPTLWTIIIGQSGTMKSPAFSAVLSPLRKRQAVAMREYQRAYDAYAQLTLDERRLHPVPPCLRFVVSDITIEALAKRLAENPRGLLLERDEFSGWVGSFNAYKKNASIDAAQYLELWRAGSIIVDRKNPEAPTLYVPRAALCITGGVQPEVLKRAFGLEHFDSGLVARFLLAFPPRGDKQWSETEIDDRMESELAAFFDRLLGIPLRIDADGYPLPEPVFLDADAKSRLVQFYNHHNKEQAELGDHLSAAWSKLEAYALRLALVIHLSRWAGRDRKMRDASLIDALSIESATTIVDWFKHETRRVYTALAESVTDRSRRELLELIQRRGGAVTANELRQFTRRYRNDPEAAERVLAELVADGTGRWEANEPGQNGRPTRTFRLSTVYETQGIPDESDGFVDIDTQGTKHRAGEGTESGNGDRT